MMKTMRYAFIGAALAALVGCGKSGDAKQPGQSFEEAITVMCDSPKVALEEESAANKASIIAKHVDANVTNEEAKKLWASFGSMDAESKRKAILDAASRAKVSKCMLADLWSSEPPAESPTEPEAESPTEPETESPTESEAEPPAE